MSLGSRRLDAQQGLRAATVVGVVRDGDQQRAARISRGLLQAGLPSVEITATTPGAFEIVEELAIAYPSAVLGVGTIRTVEQLEAAAGRGARFVVSPHTDLRLIDAAHDLDLAVIPGALTPTEIVTASDAGADFVKIFPISSMGGTAYLRSLMGPLPQVSYWVSGQVGLAEVGDYLRAGAELIGLTAALTADLPTDTDADFDAAVRSRALAALKAVVDFRDGAALLTVVVGDRRIELGLKAIRRVPGNEHTRLEALVPGRRGHAIWLRVLLGSAGLPPDAQVRLVSLDGFERVVSARALYDGGLLHYATDGHPLGRDQGGPLRLYIVHGNDHCDNIKALDRIETILSA